MFRTKIAILATLISGSVLTVFGLYFLHVIHEVSLQRIDREILALGESQLHVIHPKEHWDNFSGSLRAIYGEDRWKEICVRVTGFNGKVLYQSPHWPETIAMESFPSFDQTIAAAHAPPQGTQNGWIPPAGPPPEQLPAGHLEKGPNRHPFPPSPPPLQFRGNPRPQPTPPLKPKKPVFRTFPTDSVTWRVGIMGNPHVTILIGMDLESFYLDAQKFQKVFWVTVPIALLLLAGGGFWLAHRALKPVAAITRTAEGITAQGLDQRIPDSGAGGELNRLIRVINGMLDRLEKSFRQAIRFSADAAHELQTPLTILQGTLEDSIIHADPGSREQVRYSSLMEEVQRLKSIIQKLLILARADAGELKLFRGPVNISDMVESVIEDTEAIAPDLLIEKEIASGVIVKADRDLLRQVLQNLTTNAIKYNRENGRIRFELKVQKTEALFTISNTGLPIQPCDRERVFDRFYRVEKSRSKKIAGTGLGLSLSREIARAHHGDLVLDPPNGEQTPFRLTLPLT